MEKTYVYRKHLREPAKFFLTLGLFFIIIYTVTSFVLVSNIEDTNKIMVALIMLGTLVGISIFLGLEFLFIYLTVYKRFKKINLTLTEDEIIYNNAKSEIRIPYENIKALKFSSIKYTGGWLKIVYPNGNVRLTVVLENIGDMVENLKKKLDERNMSDVYKEKPMYNFFKTSKYSDQSFERIYENIKCMLILISINLGIGAILSGFITEIPFKIFVLIASVSGFFIPFMISEVIFGRKLAKGALQEEFLVPDRDKAFEKKINKWAFGIYIAIYYLAVIIILFN